MKITIYTIKDCAFSKQEKEYLNANKLAFEEKDLETNKEFLTEMLAISNNFAGTPVTRVEKDDGTIAVLKGFTKEEFDTTFGFASPAPVSEPTNQVTTPTEPVSAAPIPTPVVEVPVAQPSNPDLSNQATSQSDPLKSVMDDLQAKAEPTPVAPPTPVETPISEPTNQVTNNQVTEPVTPPADAPAIPDFPAK